MMLRSFLATSLSKGFSRYVPDILSRLPADGVRAVYLTFDDGPTAEGTPELLEILARYGVRATFFLVGQNALAHPRLVRDMVAAGHLIGNHSLTHIDAWHTSWRQYIPEFRRTKKRLEELTGTPVDWMRPPYGRITRRLVRWTRRHNQHLLLWDVMPGDFETSATIEGIAAAMEQRIRPGSVICLHDNAAARRVTPAALRLSLPRLLETGWQFRLPQIESSSTVEARSA